MRVVFLCDDEPFNIPRTVLEVMRRRPGDSFWVVPLGGHGSAGRGFLNAKRYFILYGAVGFVRMALRFAARRLLGSLGVTKGGPYSLAQSARAAGAGLLRVRRINSAEGRRALAALDPDVIVSVACPQVLSRRTLALARMAAVNVHSALLPRNRGMLPTFWSLLDEPPCPGVTVHEMVPEIDAGDILAQRAVRIEAGASLWDLLAECKSVAADLLVEVLEKIEQGAVERRPNPASLATVHSFPGARDVREFRRRGWRTL
ncbi:hypothetical protein GX411_05565 [Candidatus Fermentibacteria bacterium]|nr:hypothetical protein [Candidatus Fermentibacteria bacterium]